MRSSLTLALASAALAATPLVAQEASPAQAVQPAPVPVDPAPPAAAEPDAPTPPAEATDPVPVDQATSPTPAEQVATPPAPVPTTSAAPVPAPTAAPAPAPAPAPALTAEQKAAYEAWPAEAKTYFGGLTPARQAIFLRISDEDKAKILKLEAAQQEQVWASLEQQDAEQKAKQPN